MGLDLWFREDVARILAATQETMGATLGAVPPLSPDEASAYRQGFEAALQAVGVAFGVSVPRESTAWRPAAGMRVIDAADVQPRRNGGR